MDDGGRRALLPAPIDLFQSKLMTAIQHDHSGATSDILERSKQTDKLIRKLNRLGGAPSKG